MENKSNIPFEIPATAPYLTEVWDLLCQLIAIPSFSGDEAGTADLIAGFLTKHGVQPRRHLNNVWAVHPDYQPGRPTLLLNSHHDTVKPASGWTQPPHQAVPQPDGRWTGLGINDAGGPLVGLLAAFLHLHSIPHLPINIVFAASAEEENSGPNGVSALWPQLSPIHAALVGEPTGMRLAVAERGLLVLDIVVPGRSGHAARREGLNAIYEALPVVEWFRSYQFPLVSDVLGPVGMQVTGIQAGTQHNVVPAECRLVVDIRVNEHYTHQQIVDTVQQTWPTLTVTPRSMRLQASGVQASHPLHLAGVALGLELYGSPTLSDQALMPVPSVKMGPGESERSHTPDEYLYISELEAGIQGYLRYLQHVFTLPQEAWI